MVLLSYSTNAVTLKHDSFSAESALAELDESIMKFVNPCMCFEYAD